jgi:hypothetical protein
MKPVSSKKVKLAADRARVSADARVRVNPFVIAGRTSGFDWAVITEREFTGNAEDPETQMTPRPLDECRTYMTGAVGLRRIAPA